MIYTRIIKKIKKTQLFIYLFLQKVHFPVIMYNFPSKNAYYHKYLYGQPAEKE